MPLNQNILPIYWDMDCALSLYPLPDVIVVCDPSKPFETNHQGCSVVNIVSVGMAVTRIAALITV